MRIMSLPGTLRPAPGDVWGGLAAMLVAFPAAIAFGVTVYAAIAPSYAAHGALAGIVVGGLTVILWKQGSGGIFELYEMVPGVLLSTLAIWLVSRAEGLSPQGDCPLALLLARTAAAAASPDA